MNDRFTPVPAASGLPAQMAGNDLVRSDYLPDDYEQPGFKIGNFLRVIYRWRWLFLVILALTTLGAGVLTVLQTPLYRASATLELNPAPDKVLKDENGNGAQQYDRDFLSLQIGLIKSRAVAERVARKLGLARDPTFLGHPAVANSDTTDAAGALLGGFTAAGTTSDRIMQISFVHPSPGEAAKIVNGFADEAIENTSERGDEATARSRAFLQKRLGVTSQELERSERELIAYARAAHIVNIGAGKDTPNSGDTAGGTLVAGNLVALNAQLAEAQNARIVAQQRYAQAGASSASATAADSTVQALQQQRAQLQAEYDQKRTLLKPDHPDMIEIHGRLDSLQNQIANASHRTGSAVSGSLRADFTAAQNREGALRSKISQLESELLNLNDRGVRYTILKRAVDANRSLYNALLERLGQENSTATRTSSVALVDYAKVPGAPFSPNLSRALILGLFAGIVLGSAGAFGAENWYDTVNLPDDLRELLKGPVLGTIPRAPGSANVDDFIVDPSSAISEAYHSTRANLQYITAHGVPRSILFTSSVASEGKTSSAIAIAVDFISVGRSVVVIDGDLRHPSLRVGTENPGLTGLLAGVSKLEDVISATETPGLFLIPAGPTPPNPAALLDSANLQELIRRLEKQFDVVIIDGPPVLGLADAPLLARTAEATVLIVEAGKTRRSAVRDTVRRLQQAGAQVVGSVLTKFDHNSHGYGYGYGSTAYKYGAEKEKPPRALIGPKPDEGATEGA